MNLTLPYPAPVLNPNVKCHWSKKSKARKAQRDEAFWLTKQEPFPALGERVGVIITFHPPDRRHRDMDNALASLKGALDGIALALGVNDSRFNIAIGWGEPIKGGMVTVIII